MTTRARPPRPRSRPAEGRRAPIVSRGRHPAAAAPLDRLDVAVLSELQANGRASLREIARRVGASVTTVSSRVRGLERLGVLQGFVPLVSVQRLAAIGRSPQCTVVYVVPASPNGHGLDRIAARIADVPSVCYLFQLAGSSELMALASTRSSAQTAALLRSLRRIPGIAEVRPIPIARVHKERPNHPVAALAPTASAGLSRPVMA